MKVNFAFLHNVGRCVGLSLLVTACGSVTAVSQETQMATQETKVASRLDVNLTPAVNEHPLMPVIRWAEKERPKLAQIEDYTTLLTKQESIEGVIQEAQVLEVKVRHKPFSVYTKIRFPKQKNGQEAIYVEGKNEDKVIGHGVGVQRAAGTLHLATEGRFAMDGHKYPITQMGILNLVDELLEVGHKDSKYGECEVKYYDQNVKVADRECVMIQVIHPYPRPNFTFFEARIYVDKELNLPIRYESYDWPKKQGEAPALLEAYTYQNLKLNVGLKDIDFDPANPAYRYP